MESLDDLRRETRIATEEIISVNFVDQSTNEKPRRHTCRPQDVSAGGLKILTRSSLPLGNVIPLEIDLGELWSVIDVKAEVKWCLEIDDAPTFYVGVKLINIDKSNLQVWREFVKSL